MRQYFSDLKHTQWSQILWVFKGLHRWQDLVWCFHGTMSSLSLSHRLHAQLNSHRAVPGLSYHSVEFSWNKDPNQIQHTKESLMNQGGLWLWKPLSVSTITWSMTLTDDQNAHLWDIFQDLDLKWTINDYVYNYFRSEVDRVKCDHWKPKWMGIWTWNYGWVTQHGGWIC